MATLSELRELARKSGTGQKTTKRREDAEGTLIVVIHGIAVEPNAKSRAELAREVKTSQQIKFLDGTTESNAYSGQVAHDAVIGAYNAESETATATGDTAYEVLATAIRNFWLVEMTDKERKAGIAEYRKNINTLTKSGSITQEEVDNLRAILG